MLRRWDDSQKYLSDNPHLVCEETANYLVIWCIDLEVEEVRNRGEIRIKSPFSRLELHCPHLTGLFPAKKMRELGNYKGDEVGKEL